MTTEEAIKQLEYDKAMCLFNPMTGEEKPMNEDCRKSAEADGLAINALKKQIPMKAIGTHYAHMRCPSCNHRIPSGGGSSSRRRDNWCNYCGQKIDWSENNETN